MSQLNIGIRFEFNMALTTNHLTIKIIIMGNLLYTIAVILIIAWAIGFLGFHAGGIIHLLLVIAVIAIIWRLISGNRTI